MKNTLKEKHKRKTKDRVDLAEPIEILTALKSLETSTSTELNLTPVIPIDVKLPANKVCAFYQNILKSFNRIDE